MVVVFGVPCDNLQVATPIEVSWQLDGITMEGTTVRPDGADPCSDHGRGVQSDLSTPLTLIRKRRSDIPTLTQR